MRSVAPFSTFLATVSYDPEDADTASPLSLPDSFATPSPVDNPHASSLDSPLDPSQNTSQDPSQNTSQDPSQDPSLDSPLELAEGVRSAAEVVLLLRVKQQRVEAILRLRRRRQERGREAAECRKQQLALQEHYRQAEVVIHDLTVNERNEE